MEKDPISIIAHKVRTPLTVITSTANNLLVGAFGKMTDEQNKWVKKLESHTQNLEKLIDEILGILKSDSKKSAQVAKSLGTRQEKAVQVDQTMPNLKASKKTEEKVPKILIVDDEQDILDVVQEGMAMKGFETMTASNGEQALKLTTENNPDLILMDVLLQNQNGMEICKQIKSEISSFTPVILVTGQGDLREKISGAHHDADDLLTKPFQMEELFARVTSMLRMKKLYDEVQLLRGDK